MFWGSLWTSYWDEDDILERRMYDGIFQKGKSTFADITSNALSEHWRHYGGAGKSEYYWETYVSFGDPSPKLTYFLRHNSRYQRSDHFALQELIRQSIQSWTKMVFLLKAQR